MRIHMIGHASIFVETEDCNIMMDPVLFDPHCEGVEDIFPKRKVIHDQIPEFDVLVISHQHLDHFDIRSLVSLPKHVDVFIPQDKLLKTCLSRLGYSNIYYLKDESEVKIGSTHLIATRSENRVPEFGVLFADPSGVFWNQVDTDVSLQTIHHVKSRYPQIDFLLAPWQPLLETEYQFNRRLSFPYSAYSKWLEIIGFVRAKAIAPGANGFKYVKNASWLNKAAFPVTREQFCRDIKVVCPEVEENVFELDPGDIFTVENGKFNYAKGESQLIKKLDENRESLDFSPIDISKNFIDNNPDNYNLDDISLAIEKEICHNLPKFIMDNKDSLFIEHYHWHLIYQIEILFTNYSRKWYIDFSQKNIEAQQGRNPLANYLTTMTASSLYNIIKGIKGWDSTWISGGYRKFEKLYITTKNGIVKPREGEVKEPLLLRFPYNEIFKKARQQEIEKWSQAEDNNSVPYESQTFMMKIDNTLVRVMKTNNNGQAQKLSFPKVHS